METQGSYAAPQRVVRTSVGRTTGGIQSISMSVLAGSEPGSDEKTVLAGSEPGSDEKTKKQKTKNQKSIGGMMEKPKPKTTFGFVTIPLRDWLVTIPLRKEGEAFGFEKYHGQKAALKVTLYVPSIESQNWICFVSVPSPFTVPSSFVWTINTKSASRPLRFSPQSQHHDQLGFLRGEGKKYVLVPKLHRERSSIAQTQSE